MHFTYSNTPDKSLLKQGDVIAKTEGVRNILKEVHQHYLSDKYLYFIVITQSCDLVRRKGQLCGTPYITLAAVRSLDELMTKEISKYQKSPLEKKANIVSSSYKTTVSQFVSRVLNNNESEYFYLHEVPEIDFPKSVAFLKLSIAIKSELHYQTCLDAKSLELENNFKSKLGWLVGKIYSRVGTEDWSPNTLSEKAFSEFIDEIISENYFWAEDKILKELKKTVNDEELGRLAPEEILKKLKDTKIMTRKERIIEALTALLNRIDYIDSARIPSIIKLINNDPEISSILK